MTDTARALLGREPRSFRQFVRDHAALLAPERGTGPLADTPVEFARR